MAKNKHSNGNGSGNGNGDPRKPGYELAAEIANNKWNRERERADQLESKLLWSEQQRRELQQTVSLLEGKLDQVRRLVEQAEGLEFYQLHTQLQFIGRVVGQGVKRE